MRTITRSTTLLASMVAGAIALTGCSGTTDEPAAEGQVADFPFQLNFTPGGSTLGSSMQPSRDTTRRPARRDRSPGTGPE